MWTVFVEFERRATPMDQLDVETKGGAMRVRVLSILRAVCLSTNTDSD